MTIPGWPDSPMPEHPEIPYPYPPERAMPRRTQPVAVPTVDVPSGDAVDQLFARRRVLVTGVLDAATVSRVAAELMALDGRSADAVELVINSDGGPITEIVALLDVVATMRAPVAASCVGRAKGTAAVLLACASGRRRASPNAVISLRIATDERVHGRAEEVRSRLDELDLARRHAVAALARATARPEGELADELERGAVMDVERAAALGIIDSVS